MKHFKVSAKIYKWAGSIEPPDSFFCEVNDEVKADEEMLASRQLDALVMPIRTMLEGKGMRVRVASHVIELKN